MAVSKRTRYEVLRRDSYTCRYCGHGAPDVPMSVDHVIPETLGGSDEPSNLVAACRDCNSGKSSVPPDAALVADVDQRAASWAQALQAVMDERMTDRAAVRKRVKRFDRTWRSLTPTAGPLERDAGWEDSIAKFLALGLDDEYLADAARRASANQRIHSDKVWNYFCGICWRELDSVREATAAKLPASGRACAPTAPVDDETRTWLPQGAGLVPTFDALNPADSYLADALDRLDIPFHARKYVHRGLWAGWTELYRLHVADDYPPDVDRDEWEHERMNEAVADDLDAASQLAWRDQWMKHKMCEYFVRAALEAHGAPADRAESVAQQLNATVAAGFRALASAIDADPSVTDHGAMESASYPAMRQALTETAVTV